MKNKRILFCICGSFCNHEHVLKQIRELTLLNDVQIVVSEKVYYLDTRFHEAHEFIEELEHISSHEVWHTLVEVERVGPLNYYDLCVVAPMTATVLSKLNHGIYDHPVTLAVKAMLRNGKNIVIGAASNDLLGISGCNFLELMSKKHIFVVPFYQDNPYVKPTSLVSEWSLLEETMDMALSNKQIQPLLLQRRVSS